MSSDRPASPPGPPRAGRHSYHERLVPSWWWWLLVPGSALIMAIIFLPVHPNAAVGVAALTAVLVAAWLWSFATVVEVGDGSLRAGRARIDLSFIGDVHVVDAAERQALMGPQSDARSFILHRPWIPGAVRVEITDENDPAPYWMISSRHPGRLAATLTNGTGRARTGQTGQTG